MLDSGTATMSASMPSRGVHFWYRLLSSANELSADMTALTGNSRSNSLKLNSTPHIAATAPIINGPI